MPVGRTEPMSFGVGGDMSVDEGEVADDGADRLEGIDGGRRRIRTRRRGSRGRLDGAADAGSAPAPFPERRLKGSEWTDMKTPRNVSAQVEASGLHRATALRPSCPDEATHPKGLHPSADPTRRDVRRRVEHIATGCASTSLLD